MKMACKMGRRGWRASNCSEVIETGIIYFCLLDGWNGLYKNWPKIGFKLTRN
jgi:hypothetical protein